MQTTPEAPVAEPQSISEPGQPNGGGAAVAIRGLAHRFDELRVIVNPILLGAGHSLFTGLKDRVQLELLRTTTFRSGNVLLCYRPSHA